MKVLKMPYPVCICFFENDSGGAIFGRVQEVALRYLQSGYIRVHAHASFTGLTCCSFYMHTQEVYFDYNLMCNY